jgi:hypothetical protein
MTKVSARITQPGWGIAAQTNHVVTMYRSLALVHGMGAVDVTRMGCPSALEQMNELLVFIHMHDLAALYPLCYVQPSGYITHAYSEKTALHGSVKMRRSS